MLIERFGNTPISLEEAIEEHFLSCDIDSNHIRRLEIALVNLLTCDRLNLKLHEINEILETNFKEF